MTKKLMVIDSSNGETVIPSTIIRGLQIESPAADTYFFMLSSRVAFTINQLSIKTTAGTCTAKVQVNGVDVTGLTGIAVSTTISEPTASGANTVSVGNSVTLVVTSPSGDIKNLIPELSGVLT